MNCFRVWGHFLSSPFRWGHFEHTQTWGAPSPFTVHHSLRGNGGMFAVPRSTGAKKMPRAPLAPKSGVPHGTPGVGVGPGGGDSSVLDANYPPN